MCIKSITDFYGTEEYHLYCGEELEDIIRNNFDTDVYKSYQKLKPYACKADLARYCLLYLYGGLYSDISNRFIQPLDENFLIQFDLFTFREIVGSSVRNWSVSNSIIFSKPKVKILERAIRLVVENCKNETYGIQAIVPSACIPFGKAINSAGEDERICINGEILCLNSQMPYAPKKVWGFFTDYGDFIALRKPSGEGDLKTIGFPQTNNYVEMWRNKDIYDTSIKI
jgi:hypothetical protein